MLAKNEKAKDVGSRIQLASKQPKNLHRLVGGDKCRSGGEGDPTPEGVGCKKCKGCHVCPKIEETGTFRSTNTRKVYKIKQSVNCSSDWVIYLVTCQKCFGQYVGKSQTIFKKRHSNHKQEVKKQIGGLGHHYGGGGGSSYDDFKVTLIEQVKERTKEFLAERELYWQHQLRVYVQNGHKAHCYRKDFG